MKKNNRKKVFNQPVTLSDEISTLSSPRVPSPFPPPTLKVEGANRVQEITIQTEVQLTIQLKVSEFTRKQATLLAGQALYEVIQSGMTIGDWMVLEFLYNYLLGNKSSYEEIRQGKEVEILLLLKVVLLSGNLLGLEEKVELPPDIKQLLLKSRWIPNHRTYASRREQFELKKFLKVRIVPLDLFMKRSQGTVRYSSYCKGYGEGTGGARAKKTKHSAELDGEPVDLTEKGLLLTLSEIPFLLQLVLQELKLKSHHRK